MPNCRQWRWWWCGVSNPKFFWKKASNSFSHYERMTQKQPLILKNLENLITFPLVHFIQPSLPIRHKRVVIFCCFERSCQKVLKFHANNYSYFDINTYCQEEPHLRATKLNKLWGRIFEEIRYLYCKYCCTAWFFLLPS